MGETDEFEPQSLPVGDETAHEPAVEQPAELGTDEPAEPIIEQSATQPDATPDAQADADELDDISQSLSEQVDADEVAENTDGAVADSGADADAGAAAADTGADSFDDIVAPDPAAAAVAQPQEPPLKVGQVPWWPFLIYLGAWIALAALAVWQLLQLPVGQAVYESPAYSMTILGGLIMTAMGPLLILAVWLGTRANRPAQEREGLLTSALMKGALVTLSGAIIWWASLVIIDYLRLGRLL